MPDDEVFALIAAERRRAADMFAQLTPEQWDAPSLCSQWQVRDIAGHLAGPFCVSIPRFLAGAVLAGGVHRYSTEMARRLGRRPAAELAGLLRANAETRFAPPGTGPAAPLTDLAVHTRDVARPLGLAACAAPRAWRQVLGFLTSPRASRGFVPRGRLAGLRLAAADLDWAHGAGAEVRGPAEALALALCGRAAALPDLTGEGAGLLAARLG